MPYFDNQGVKIYYEIEGNGPDLVLIHGFAASIESNWRNPKWVDILKKENRLILMDCRGHGKSDKPLDPSDYGAKMLDDIKGLMDHLSIENANFFGYSMGSRLTLNLLIQEPERVKSAILSCYVLPPKDGQKSAFRGKSVVKAFKAGSIEEVEDEVGKQFRLFAESTGADLDALSALMAGGRQETEDLITMKALRNISVPVMTVVGSVDFLPGDKTAIAKIVPGACHFQIQGKGHITILDDPKFHMAVKAFLSYVNGA